MHSGSRVTLVGLSESVRIVDDGFFRFGRVGTLIGLFLQDIVDGGFSCLFSALVLLCKPFKSSYIELLLGVLVLLLDDLEDAHDLGSHSLLLNRKIPAVDDFLICEFSERDNWSDHDNFIEGDTLLHSMLIFNKVINSLRVVSIEHHWRRFLNILRGPWRST